MLTRYVPDGVNRHRWVSGGSTLQTCNTSSATWKAQRRQDSAVTLYASCAYQRGRWQALVQGTNLIDLQ